MESDEGQEVSHLLQLIYTAHQEHLRTVNAPLAMIPLLFMWILYTATGRREHLNR